MSSSSNAGNPSAMKEPQPRPRTRKGRGVETAESACSIGVVLDEARHEICCLEQKNSQMEDALADLHKWLAGVQSVARKSVNSVSDATANVSAAMQTSLNPEETFVTILRSENEDLRSQLNKLKELSDVLTKRLDGQYQEVESKDRSELKEKLSTSSLMCKQMEEETEKNVTKRRKSFQGNKIDVSSQVNNFSSVLDESNVDELHRQLCDALEKNARWQSYNGEREQYVGALLAKYQQVSTQLQECRDRLAQVTSNPDKLAAEQRRYFDNLLVDARRELEHQRGEYLKTATELDILRRTTTEETKRLKSDVEHWRTRYEDQRETVATLTANYESERRRSNTSAKETKEKQSQIQLLQRQVEIFREDFRAERKEKEAAEHEMVVLRDRVKQLEQQIEQMKQERGRPRNFFLDDILACDDDKPTSDDVCCGSDDTPRGRRPASPPKRHQRRRDVTPTDITSRQFSDVRTRRNAPAPPTVKTKRRGERLGVAADKSINEPARRATRPINSKSAQRTPSDSEPILQCPTCGRKYQIDEHMLLLDHIDVCGD